MKEFLGRANCGDAEFDTVIQDDNSDKIYLSRDNQLLNLESDRFSLQTFEEGVDISQEEERKFMDDPK